MSVRVFACLREIIYRLNSGSIVILLYGTDHDIFKYTETFLSKRKLNYILQRPILICSNVKLIAIKQIYFVKIFHTMFCLILIPLPNSHGSRIKSQRYIKKVFAKINYCTLLTVSLSLSFP